VVLLSYLCIAAYEMCIYSQHNNTGLSETNNALFFNPRTANSSVINCSNNHGIIAATYPVYVKQQVGTILE